MTWWAIVPPVAVAIVLVLLPGVAIAYAATARGVTAWGLAPALSMTGYAVLGLVYGVTKVPWTLVTVVIGMVALTAVVVVAAWLLTRGRIRPPFRDGKSVGLAALIGIIVAFVLVGVRFAFTFGSPDAISQTYDAVFHLNAVRYILATGDANPLTFGTLSHAFVGGGSFYPNLWHMVASVTVQGSGASIPVAANALSIVIGGLIWPLSIVVLVRQLVGSNAVALMVAGAFSACFAAFPLLLVQFGVLYPNLLGLAILPAAVAAMVMATRLAHDAVITRTIAWVVLIVLLPGLALAHPNAIVSLLVVGAPIAVTFGWRWMAAARERNARLSTFAFAALAAVVIAVAWVTAFAALRPSQAAASWPPLLGRLMAIWNAVANAQLWPAAVEMSVLIILGVIAAFVRKRNRWLVVSTLLVDFFYVAAAYLPIGDWRYWIVGSWYSDPYRLIALGPVVLVPLATLGLLWLGELCGGVVVRLARAPDSMQRAAKIVTATSLVIAAVAVVGAQLGQSLSTESAAARTTYQVTDESVLLTRDELTLIKRLPSEVPKSAIIAGDPWTGASLSWSLADRRTLVPAIKGRTTAAGALIMSSLNKATPGSATCAAVKDEHVSYALDFGTVGIFGPTDANPGVHHLRSSSAVELVDAEGSAGLYRITAC